MGDPSINVETSELSRFAEDVRFEADEVLAPAVGRATLPLREGVSFGAQNASGAVHAAKLRYAQSLGRSMGNLAEFVEAARIMAAAAQMAAQEFEAADSRSAEAAVRVNGMFRAAEAAPAASSADEPGGIPPLALAGVGVALLVVAPVAVTVAVRRSRRG